MNAATLSMLEILAYVEAEIARGANTIELDVLDPDAGAGHFAGELVASSSDRHYVHRPLRVWVDLAERLRLRLRTPRAAQPPLLRLTFERLKPQSPADAAEVPTSGVRRDDAPTEKYGASSEFARVHKLEDPRFVIDLTEALDRVVTSLHAHVGMNAPAPRADEPIRVLDLGVNTGDELAFLLRIPALREAQIVGVDHSTSAIAVARERFAAHPNIRLVEADVTQLKSHDLGRFDLVVCIGTLQSGALDDRELLRHIVQHHLAPNGAVILGMPNCRYVDGEVEYGARIVNITQPELGLLFKDVAFYRKYLQQHHKKVFVTGKHYVLVTGVAT